MAWPKGRRRTPEDLRPKPRNNCLFCGAQCQKIGATWCSQECRNQDPIYREELKQIARDPAWRQKVSEATKERMRDPEVRERHLTALREAMSVQPDGHTFSGGKGREPNELEKWYAGLLQPLGYIWQFVVVVDSNGRHYDLDFAHVENKINVEIDGSSHRGREQKDTRRDETLRNMGWKVIRVRHW